MSKLERRRIIGIKIESTPGTDSVPTASSDAILVEELAWGLEGLRMVQRPAIRGSIASLQQLYGGSLMSVTFKVEVKGSGAAGTPPELGVALRGCSLDETIVASTSVAYAPVSSSPEYVSIYVWEDGTLQKLTGCQGMPEFSTEAGGRVMATFTFFGHFSGPTDVTFPTPSYISTVPPVALSSSFSVGGFGAVVGTFSFTLGNELKTPPDLNATDGYSMIRIAGRDVNGQFDPEQPLVATADFMAMLKAGTTQALNFGPIGSAGNQLQIGMPAIAYRGLSPGIREGVQIYQLLFGAAESSGDDDVTFTFT